MNGDEMLKVFIAKFDVQPWDLTHQVGYLSLPSPSVCAIFYNSENMNVLGIRIVNPWFYFIPRVIMCTYMLIISFMVMVALESRAFCRWHQKLMSRETNCRVIHDLHVPKRKLGVRKDATAINPFGCWIFL